VGAYCEGGSGTSISKDISTSPSHSSMGDPYSASKYSARLRRACHRAHRAHIAKRFVPGRLVRTGQHRAHRSGLARTAKLSLINADAACAACTCTRQCANLNALRVNFARRRQRERGGWIPVRQTCWSLWRPPSCRDDTPAASPGICGPHARNKGRPAVPNTWVGVGPLLQQNHVQGECSGHVWGRRGENYRSYTLHGAGHVQLETDS
jgi:hypothetical protein